MAKVTAQLPRAFADLAILDPPYNIEKNYAGRKFHRISNIDYANYTEAWLEQVLPLLRPGASIYVCCDWASSPMVMWALSRHTIVRNRITWQREKGRSSKVNWKNAMEDIYFATVGKDYTFNADAVRVRRRVVAPYREDGAPKDWEDTPQGRFRDTGASNFWDDITVPYWSMPENTAHPTQKPEKLLAKLILASSNPGDIVLDPFLGSGSTAVTAAKLDRHFVGIEQSDEYCALAMKRLERAQEDPTIQGYTDGVFWERNTKAAQSRVVRGD